MNKSITIVGVSVKTGLALKKAIGWVTAVWIQRDALSEKKYTKDLC